MGVGYAIASFFFPGLGQALSRRYVAAAIWAAIATLAWLTILASVWLVPNVLLARIACAIDAARKPRSPGGVLEVLASVVVCIAVMVGGQLAVRAFAVEAFKIPASSMMPTLQIGDHVFINKLAKSPSRGDVIVFRMPCDPDRDYVKRVIGLAGDRVEIRCDVVYINGVATPRALAPGACTYDDFDESSGESFTRACSLYHEGDYDTFHAPIGAGGGDPAGPQDGFEKDFPQPGRPPPSCASGILVEAAPATNQQPGRIVNLGMPVEGRPCDRQAEYIVPDGHVFVLGDNRSNSNDSRFWGSVPVENIKGKLVGIWYARSLSRIGPVR